MERIGKLNGKTIVKNVNPLSLKTNETLLEEKDGKITLKTLIKGKLETITGGSKQSKVGYIFDVCDEKNLWYSGYSGNVDPEEMVINKEVAIKLFNIPEDDTHGIFEYYPKIFFRGYNVIVPDVNTGKYESTINTGEYNYHKNLTYEELMSFIDVSKLESKDKVKQEALDAYDKFIDIKEFLVAD